MLKKRIKIFICVLTFACNLSKAFAGFSAAHIDYSSQKIKAAVRFLDSVKNKDYARAWKSLTELTQQGFGSIENFKKWCLERPDMIHCGLQGQITLTNKRTVILVLAPGERIPDFGRFILLKENGKWKVGLGRFSRIKAEADMKTLAEAIERYYTDNKSYPENLLRLTKKGRYIKKIPFDPFNDEDRSYVYKTDGQGWILYSFGPDCDDDLGIKEGSYGLSLVDGDIIIRGGSAKQ